MSIETPEMVTVPRAEWESLRAEVRRLRRAVGQQEALSRIEADSGPGDAVPTFSRDQLAEAWGITE